VGDDDDGDGERGNHGYRAMYRLPIDGS